MFLHSVHGRGDDAAPQKERDRSRQKLLANCGCQNEGTQGLISQSCGQDYSLLDIQCVAPTDFPSRYVCSALPQIRSTAKNTTHSEWQTEKFEWALLLPRQGREHLFLQQNISLSCLPDTCCSCHDSHTSDIAGRWCRAVFFSRAQFLPRSASPLCWRRQRSYQKYSMCSRNQRVAECLLSTRQIHSLYLASPHWVINSATLT